jgi:hypothetical protein
MGWKTASIVCTNAKDPQYFASSPTHLPDEATRVAKLLGYQFVSREMQEFNDYPKEGHFIIGAYEKGLYIADQDILFDCFADRDLPYFQAALKLYPEGELLIVNAHSVSSMYGFAYYRKGKLIREYAWTGEDGVLMEEGEPEPEENEADHEESCFGMLSKFFGDYDNALDLQVEKFVKAKK